MPSGINTGGICSFIYRHRSYLSLLGVTPRISQDERSSVITHESTPSVSMMMALAHRSSVKRTSCKSERESGERGQVNLGDGGTRDYPAAPTRFRVTRRRGGKKEDAEEKKKRAVSLALLLLLTSRRCQRLSATPMLFASCRTNVPEPWFIFRLGVPPISSGKEGNVSF